MELKWCLLIVLFSGAVQGDANLSNCSSHWTFEDFSEKLKVSDECIESLAAQWTEGQNAMIMDNLNRLLDIFKKHQKTVCKDFSPVECPAPMVHSKGGLVCVSSEGRRYCKPMCNEGNDFSFLRKSRPYEECSAATNHKWTSQYVGSNRLAVCNKSNVQISAVASSYFPQDKDCWKTKSEQVLELKVIKEFEEELEASGVKGPFTHGCLTCG